MTMKLMNVMLASFCLLNIHTSFAHSKIQGGEGKTILVFSPHPDDDVIGCGGTILQQIKAGSKVIIIYLTSGENSCWPGGKEELAILREKEAQEAANKLGVSELIFLRKPDSGLSGRINETIPEVKDLIAKYVPHYIFIPHEHDNHKDHSAANSIVTAAFKEALASQNELKQCTMLGYEVWTPIQHITHTTNISSDMAHKIQALSEHKTQTKYIDYVGAIEALNKYRGIMVLFDKFAECFKEIKSN